MFKEVDEDFRKSTFCYLGVWHVKSPLDRHAHITMPHLNVHSMNADQEEINIAEKPVPLTKLILQHYAEPHSIVFITRSGSGSEVIAALDLKLQAVAVEKDINQWNASTARIKNFIAGFEK